MPREPRCQGAGVELNEAIAYRMTGLSLALGCLR
jgi:hypothetical protein